MTETTLIHGKTSKETIEQENLVVLQDSSTSTTSFPQKLDDKSAPIPFPNGSAGERKEDRERERTDVRECCRELEEGSVWTSSEEG